MNIVSGFMIALTSGLMGSLIGGGLGYSIGRFAPDYYRTVFPYAREADVDLTQVGLGLGITQGFVAGLVVGVAIVWASTWRRSRTSNNSTGRPLNQ